MKIVKLLISDTISTKVFQLTSEQRMFTVLTYNQTHAKYD